jgi:hypothetical protein
MKKQMSLLLAFVAVFGLASCDDSSVVSSNRTSTNGGTTKTSTVTTHSSTPIVVVSDKDKVINYLKKYGTYDSSDRTYSVDSGNGSGISYYPSGNFVFSFSNAGESLFTVCVYSFSWDSVSLGAGIFGITQLSDSSTIYKATFTNCIVTSNSVSYTYTIQSAKYSTSKYLSSCKGLLDSSINLAFSLCNSYLSSHSLPTAE